MRTFHPLLCVLLLASGVCAAGEPKDAVKDAAKKLGEQPGYSWKSSPISEGAANRFDSTVEGMTQKDGFTLLSVKSGENPAVEAALKGGKVAVKAGDGWKGSDEIKPPEQGQPRDPVASLARRLANFKAPPAEAEDLAGKAKELKELKDDGGALAGELTEDAAKELLSRGRGRGGNNPPQVADPKGSVKFWIKDGVLVKYEYKVQGKVTFNQREVDVNRTTTVEIKDVGTTKVEVPDEAKKKL